MVEIYIDADACPVRDEALKVADRHRLVTWVVSNGGIRPPRDPMARLVIVPEGADAADDWIAERIGANDVVVTNDIPLASRCLEKGARALRPNGKVFTGDSIGMELAGRDLMAGLREAGQITGGPPPFSKQDRSRFLDAMETVVQAGLRATR
ncbi:MAG: YaiI/YqxD family protein [Rhodospirillales bacterium]|nr:YaiI/YqxD family protein [Rhodospirillales bacterium]MCW9039684.1 YaiI/YqxD family protein [Rhodospirillales bacterium]